MGFAISWMAVKGRSKEYILSFFDFSETQEKGDFPESDISSSELPSGWYFLWFNKCESPFVQSEVLSDLSQDCSVISCVVEEHVMYSRSEYWEGGALKWKIIHNSQNGMYDLELSGAMPDYFEELKSEIFAKQDAEGGVKADVDLIFDLPLEPIKRITFFKHDEFTPELEGQEYTVLASNKEAVFAPKSKPWWKVW
nr:hypothetical protein [uncultured Desulfobacter sp.]